MASLATAGTLISPMMKDRLSSRRLAAMSTKMASAWVMLKLPALLNTAAMMMMNTHSITLWVSDQGVLWERANKTNTMITDEAAFYPEDGSEKQQGIEGINYPEYKAHYKLLEDNQGLYEWAEYGKWYQALAQ